MAYLTENLAELWMLTPGFDDLLLTGESVTDDGTFSIQAEDENTSWGNPSPLDVSVQRWMTDGAVASTQGYENREITFQVTIEAETPKDLAAGEAALAKRAGKQCSLKWVTPSGEDEAPPTVFVVWTWHFTHSFSSTDEAHVQRAYTVTMTAAPWVRSDTLTEVDALPTVVTPTVTSVDTCASTFGWTGVPNTVTASGGALHESYTVTSTDVTDGRGAFGLSVIRVGTVSGLTATPYVAVDASITGGTGSIAVKASGSWLVKVASLGTTSWWQLPDGADGWDSFEVIAFAERRKAGALTLNLADVSATDTPGGVGTHKQLFRTIDVGGSVPTSGSIEIASPSSTALGTVLVYTCPDDGSGYVPSMRRFRTAGYDSTLATDSTTVSGYKERVDWGGSPAALFTATVPPGQFTEATYAVVARMQCDAAVTEPFKLNASIPVAQQIVVTAGSVKFAAANTWQWCPIGVVNLPPTALPAESQTAITLALYSDLLDPSYTAHNIWLDDLYLFDMTHGGLTIVDADALTAATRLWVDAPDADPVRNRPAIYLGTADDRSDAYGAISSQILHPGDHDLDPNGAVLFTVTDGVADATATAAFFQRWHTHAGA